MPRLSAWYRKLQGQGLVILGVDNGEPPDTARTYAKKLHIAYPVLADPNGVTSAMYDVTAMPTTVLVDRRGVVASVHLGVLDPTYLRSHIVPLLTARG
jgi:peroxiredoxin